MLRIGPGQNRPVGFLTSEGGKYSRSSYDRDSSGHHDRFTCRSDRSRAAGLCAAKHLIQRDMDVTIFELGSQIGGLWVYENPNGRSPAYRSLHINSEAGVTSYLDFPYPEDTPFYPSHEKIAGYLEAYADHFDLRRHIRFDTKVAAAEPIGSKPELH